MYPLLIEQFMAPVALAVSHFWQRRRALLWLKSLHPKQSLARVRIPSRPGAAAPEISDV